MTQNFCIKLLILSAFFLLASFASAQDEEPTPALPDTNTQQPDSTTQTESEKLFWIFLTTGKTTEGVDKEQIEKMQAQHLANFTRLASEEKLLLAGPLSDPEKKLRGIVVLKAKDKTDLSEMFKTDPYVNQGFMKVEATEMDFKYGTINTQTASQGLDELRLVLFENADTEKPIGAAASNETKDFISKMSSDKALLLTAFLPKTKCARTALMIMAKSDDDQKISKKVQDIPAVKTGIWKSRVIPLYVGKGVLTSS